MPHTFDPGSVSIFILGLLMGAQHTLDADHIVAISTITSENKGLWRSCVIGMCWGFGHMTILLLAGLLVLLFRLTIPQDVARLFEAGVGAMLVGLGVSVGLSLWRERMHIHLSGHVKHIDHVHPHSHRHDLAHRHLHRFRLEYKSLAIGMIHGLAGSAALLLVVVSTAQSLFQGLLYIFLFGVGSIGGMMVLSAILSVPLLLTPERWLRAHLTVRAMAGLASVALGSGILYSMMA